MEWVHCNSCFCQPFGDKKDVCFSLTSCGHIFCTNCQRKDFCSLCKKKCSVVSLSNQLLSDVKVYFSNPVTLFEKLILELERVYMFQKNQREQLFKHKKEEIKQNSQKVMNDIQILEREVMDLEKQLNSLNVAETSVEPHPLTSSIERNAQFAVNTATAGKPSPASLTPKVAQPPPQISSLGSIPYHCPNPAIVGYCHPQSPSNPQSLPHPPSQTSCQLDSLKSSNGSQLLNQSQYHNHQPHSYPQTHSNAQVHSNSPIDRPRTSPMNMKHRVLMYGQQKNLADTSSSSIGGVQSNSPHNAKRPRIDSSNMPARPARLCVRTPPIDGKIGVIPGSAEAMLRSKLISPVSGSTSLRISPASAGKQNMYTPGSNFSQTGGSHYKGRSVFPNSNTPDSIQPCRHSLSPQVQKTPITGINSNLLTINPRKTH